MSTTLTPKDKSLPFQPLSLLSNWSNKGDQSAFADLPSLRGTPIYLAGKDPTLQPKGAMIITTVTFSCPERRARSYES